MSAAASPRPAQIPALTGLRAYAAIWVMLLHFQHGIGVEAHVRLGGFIDRGGWAVDIFFVLSGFILSLLYAPRLQARLRLAEWREYLAARFARIYPLHLLTLAALALFFLGRRLVDGTPLPAGFNLEHLWLNAALLHGWGFAERLSWNFPSWSISTEWFAYLCVMPLLVYGLRRVPALGVLALALAGWTALYLLLHGRGETIGTQSVHWGLPRIAVEFALGYGLYRAHLAWRPPAALADALALAGLALLLAIGVGPAAWEWALAPAVCALVFGLSHTGPIGQALCGGPRAVFWGERSYSIYLLHAVVQIYCNLLLLRLGLAELSPAEAWTVVALQVAAVLLLSHLVYGRFEVPMRVWLRRRLTRAPVPASGAAGVLPERAL